MHQCLETMFMERSAGEADPLSLASLFIAAYIVDIVDHQDLGTLLFK